MHALALLMCHTHYTLIQPETPGLIVITLPNKILKQMLWMYYSHWDIQWQTPGLKLSRQHRKHNAHTNADIIFTCIQSTWLCIWSARDISAVLF